MKKITAKITEGRLPGQEREDTISLEMTENGLSISLTNLEPNFLHGRRTTAHTFLNREQALQLADGILELELL